MKKLVMISLTAALLFVGLSSASAMTEKELKNKLTSTYTINGETYSLSSDNKVLVQRYLDENEVSSKDADYIASKIDEAVAIIKKAGVKSIDELSNKAKDELKALVSDISSNTSVKATINSGNIVIYNNDGTVFAKSSVDNLGVGNGLVKQTGTVNNIAIVAGVAFVITLVGACLIVRQVKTNN